MSAAAEPLLRVQGLMKHFPIRKGGFGLRPAGAVRTVDGVSFDIVRGETLGLVDKSGCGKSTIGRLLVRLLEPSAGRIVFDGIDIATMSAHRLRPLRPQFQIIAQAPYGSLNPRMRVEEILREPMQVAAPARSVDQEGQSGGGADCGAASFILRSAPSSGLFQRERLLSSRSTSAFTRLSERPTTPKRS